MRATLLLAAAALAAAPAAFAQQQRPAAIPASAAAVPDAPGAAPYDPDDPWIWGDVAKLRGLDKVTAETRDFEAKVGEDTQFMALTVSVKRCAKRPPELQPETIVGMEIYDRRTDGQGGAKGPARIFSGWMFGSSPALNPLEHGVYDVWVLDCINSKAPPEDVANEGPIVHQTTAAKPGEVAD